MWHVWGRGIVYTGFGGEPQGRKLFERPWRKWENNVKINVKEIA
jgi:hypothetical protein